MKNTSVEQDANPREAWRPILSGEAATSAWARVEAIAEALTPSNVDADGLKSVAPTMEGGVGIALFFGYLSRVVPGRGYDEIADWWMELGADQELMARSLLTGLTGKAWLTAHFDGMLYEIDNESWSEPLDRLLTAELENAGAEMNWDLVKGLSGSGVYFLERLSSQRGRAGLRAFVDHVERIHTAGPEGVTWLYHPKAFFFESNREQAPEGVYNLTTAHGNLGVMAVLAGAARAGVERQRAEYLLQEAWRWFWGHLSPEREDSAFPASYSISDPTRGAGQSQRLCWCRGDLGAAVVLQAIAEAQGNAEWKEAATTLGVRALKRSVRPVEIQDPGLCHGAIGAGHLANRLYQATGVELFKEHATFWLQRGLDLCEDRHTGTGGVWSRQREGGDVGPWFQKPTAGFLLGAAGVGLGLLAATTDIEPSWDRLLLLSLAEP